VLYSQVLRTLAFSARKTFAVEDRRSVVFEEWLIRVSSLIVSITGQSWPHRSLRGSPLIRFYGIALHERHQITSSERKEGSLGCDDWFNNKFAKLRIRPRPA